MISTLHKDIPASIVVFLVALPLCLGIALASGTPLISGLISGIVGGIIVGILSQSHVSVSGPAAGLAAVVLSAINQLQVFEIFLMAVVLAGIFQLIAGIAKAGLIADYVPNNVIKGLLAAIGIILILKQIPHAVGLDKDAEGEFSFFQPDGETTFSELFNIFAYFSWGPVIISLLSLFVLIYWHKTPFRKVSFFPASLFVVLLGVALNALFKMYFPHFVVSEEHLVKIPEINSLGELITLPDFGSIANPQVWLIALTIALVASLETLLNLEAVENIDPYKRKASPNRELIAQGVGNIASGLAGGIPVTSVIIRSSVNINSGGATKLSAIMHGFFLLFSVLLISRWLNLIPLASLAAILLVTGYKLARIPLFVEMYKKGLNQFIPFVVTILAIVFTDLLVGIFIGLGVSIFYLLKSNYKNPFVMENEQLNIGETLRIELANQVSFLNKASIKETLWDIPENSKVIIDASYSDFIDQDVLEILQDFKDTRSKDKNIQLNLIGLKEKYKLKDHIQFLNVLDKERQAELTPDDVLEILKRGNERFVKGKWTEKYFTHQVNATSFGQNPIAVIVSCIDSRTTPEIIFDLGLGDILSIRIAGNVINEEVLGSIELACKKIGTKLVVILGHSQCGAIATAISQENSGHIHTITDKINRSVEACQHLAIDTFAKDYNKTIGEKNVQFSIDDILENSTYIANEVKERNIKIVAAFYETETGEVSFL
ncbi:MAG: SulP family inorganic anion transporter [Chitinophagales bacterium]|nr:bifunctional SulP family inorganic anion transporter/carbonic anhydrase [Bacteroidota bacterium]MCB9043839.1 bifunctional SulP family inorganic anion transporter/carbonic anhydrase [Chitinophagales bacterium]